MTNYSIQWTHRWFGVWSEYGAAYQKCPSAASFVVPAVNRRYDKARLRSYLTSAPVVASTSRRSFPNPFTGEVNCGSISFRTDGEWLWLDDLADYIDNNELAIPSTWLEEIIRKNYIPPNALTNEAIAKLEWPEMA